MRQNIGRLAEQQQVERHIIPAVTAGMMISNGGLLHRDSFDNIFGRRLRLRLIIGRQGNLQCD